jgi:hypothetical protein
MRTTVDLAEDALLAARQIASREKISLGEAITRLIRRGTGADPASESPAKRLRGRFALLPERDEVITPEHVRELMEREVI